MRNNFLYKLFLRLALLGVLGLALIGCSSSSIDRAPAEMPPATETAAPTLFQATPIAAAPRATAIVALPTSTVVPSPTPNWTATPDIRLRPNNWRAWPVLPLVSARAIEIYQAGLAAGNNPHAFTVIGDCQSQPPVFFGIYATDWYYFGAGFEYLQEVVDYYPGAFDRQSAAVADGMSVASVFSPLWATHPDCRGNESPLDCELRINNPSLAIISLGTNWKAGADATFEEHLRRLVAELIAHNVLPILVTKADNVEGDGRLNEIMAEIAYEEDIPLWNFWRAVQHLPNGGIDPETKGGLIYLLPEAWNVKSFTGVQALDALLKATGAYAP